MMWSDAYLLGVDQIDQQHKQLIGVLDDLAKCVRKDHDIAAKQCKQTISFMKTYAITLFSAEEMLMEKIEYPLLEGHREKHDRFKRSIHELELRLMQSDYSVDTMQEVVHVLTNWWLFHIVKEDKKLAPYISKNEDKIAD